LNGVYFINEKIKINGLSENESMELQRKALAAYIEDHAIEIAKLNPYQFYDHYTIPHALLYDLKKMKTQLDCLILYSPETIEDYVKTYPARWLILKSFFNDVVTVTQHANLLQL
jgi:hypothetical protein